MNDRERIEQALELRGLTAQAWDEEGEDGLTAIVGHYTCIEDDERSCSFAGDEGIVTACVVGAAQYGNQRVCFSFQADGNDGGMEVGSLDSFDPTD